MSTTETLTKTVNPTSLSLNNHHATSNVGHNDNAIQADVAYLKYEPTHELEKLYTMNYDTGGTFPRTNAKNELNTISIQNIRKMKAPPSFDTCGFATRKLQSVLKMADFDDSAKVEDVFYTEVKDLLKEMYPDACAIEVLEHQIRKRTQQFPYHTGEPYKNLLPTTLVHIDFTSESAALTGRAVFKDSADRYPNLLVVNLWKSLQGPGDDWPLALCDVRTVDYEKDVVSQDLVFDNRFNENLRVYYSDKHKWYYYANLQDDEIVVFQQMDSRARSGRGVPHSGFLNPCADEDAAPRVSVEIRVFINFK
ncbi:hypothetical protein K505DRAFT_343458 [Melanomma pulvis-pyrius CBS 109.77]|uniref:CmcJ-like methyltransferase n=1 Tax=Melanomma pulvis-pyrius CBS 109.77 TaxID=1314802 RepID=A0A6A6WRW9_9PLEO|nr:hypothetical protein K505DRAFT_343458 [Melanomma pulvis-pyrius CBS 109.77]